MVPRHLRSRSRPVIDMVVELGKCGAALGSRTPDLRITSTPAIDSMVLGQPIRARRSAHRAQSRTPLYRIGDHEGGHAGDPQDRRVAVPGGQLQAP
jgi:hypothetical protein